MKPILFNTEMVRAILEGRKTVTRRVAFPNRDLKEFPRPDNPDAWWFRGRMYRNWGDAMDSPQAVMSLCRFRPGDILYVRETWSPLFPNHTSNVVVGYMYKADDFGVEEYDKRYPNGKDWEWLGKWKPSIHMPKEAARIFLRVTDVRVERLQDMSEDDVVAEGAESLIQCQNEHPTYNADGSYGEMCWNTDCCRHCEYINKSYAELFGVLVWDRTIKKADIDLYGWDANPWCWVIDFERCDKPKGEQDERFYR